MAVQSRALPQFAVLTGGDDWSDEAYRRDAALQLFQSLGWFYPAQQGLASIRKQPGQKHFTVQVHLANLNAAAADNKSEGELKLTFSGRGGDHRLLDISRFLATRPVTVYVMRWCGHCKTLMRTLGQAGLLGYCRIVDLAATRDGEPDQWATLRAETDMTSVPVVVVSPRRSSTNLTCTQFCALTDQLSALHIVFQVRAPSTSSSSLDQ